MATMLIVVLAGFIFCLALLTWLTASQRWHYTEYLYNLEYFNFKQFDGGIAAVEKKNPAALGALHNLLRMMPERLFVAVFIMMIPFTIMMDFPPTIIALALAASGGFLNQPLHTLAGRIQFFWAMLGGRDHHGTWTPLARAEFQRIGELHRGSEHAPPKRKVSPATHRPDMTNVLVEVYFTVRWWNRRLGWRKLLPEEERLICLWLADIAYGMGIPGFPLTPEEFTQRRLLYHRFHFPSATPETSQALLNGLLGGLRQLVHGYLSVATLRALVLAAERPEFADAFRLPRPRWWVRLPVQLALLGIKHFFLLPLAFFAPYRRLHFPYEKLVRWFQAQAKRYEPAVERPRESSAPPAA
ncbi:MAG: hypothetical protein HYV42_00800 [Candidatus Magasanikbacteria bacterium]|nr:hypothetical protein [Candidatus Magasanikbacteria bacterium]